MAARQKRDVLQRKIQNRLLAMRDENRQIDVTSGDDQQTTFNGRWLELEDSLHEANNSRIVISCDVYTSSRRIIGRFIVFGKRAVRKLIKIFFGWYLNPIYARQSTFNGKILNAVSLLSETVAHRSQQMDRLNAQVADMQKSMTASLQQIQQRIENNTTKMAEDKYALSCSVHHVYLLCLDIIEKLKTKSKELDEELAKVQIEHFKQNDETRKSITEDMEQLRAELGHSIETVKSEQAEQNAESHKQITEVLLVLQTEINKGIDSVKNAQIKEKKELMCKVEEQILELKEQLNHLSVSDDHLHVAVQEILPQLEELRRLISDLNQYAVNDDQFYHDLEERFRGSYEEIVARQSSYLSMVKKYIPDFSKATFIDIGSGRGEWLDVIRANGAVTYVGVDMNETQNVIARSNGHQVVCMDGIKYLKTLENDSVDMISGFQVIEHLSMRQLAELLKEAYRVLKKGGIILFETVNPQNLCVGANTFYLDPSHQRPLDPDYTQFVMEYCGFVSVEKIDMNSHPSSAPIQEQNEGNENKELIDRVNLLSWKLFGPQDYAMIGVKE